MVAILYTRDKCTYCDQAKRLLNDQGIEYQEIDATKYREALIQKVMAITGTAPKTVPQIWLDEVYIGGFNELNEHLKNKS